MIPFEVVFNAFLFSITFLLVLFLGVLLPGFLLLRLLAPKTALTYLESALYSLALGIGLIDVSLLLLGKLEVPLNSSDIGLWYLGLFLLFALILRFRKIPLKNASEVSILTNQREWKIGIILVAFIFFIKVFYLSGTILPTATDLGHHLYWSKLTSDSQMLPVYEKQEIIRNADGSHALSANMPISDFIIGEHLPISFFHIFTGASYFGTFPALFLFLLNLSSTLAYALLFFYIGKNIVATERFKFLTPSSFFLLALFVFGGLFSLASPEMKFVSGGVIGNLFGNLFIPLLLLLLIRALMEKSAHLLALFFLLTAILAYTHHLSTFVLLYVLLFFILSLLVFWRVKFFALLKEAILFLRYPVAWGTLIGILLFASFIALPTYLETNAIGTAVGTPTKDTRTGLTFLQLTLSNSAYKLGLAIFSIILIASLASLRRNIGAVLLFAYGVVLLVMTLAPALLWIDIPSNRIAHYLSFPLTLLALFATLFVVEKYVGDSSKRHSLANPFVLGGLVLFFLALVAPGLEDNSKTLTSNSQGLYVKETFAAARYLQDKVNPGELILRDHNFIQASDTWMKLFFSKGYNYPLSRSFFKRYEDNPNREQCTLAMIATPNTPFGKKCYQDLPVRFLVINPKFDTAQFLKSDQFSLIYASPNIAILEYIPQPN